MEDKLFEMTIKLSDLLSGYTLIKNLVPKVLASPVLYLVYLEVTENQLTLVGSDSFTAGYKIVPCEANQNFSMCWEPHIFDLIKDYPKSSVLEFKQMTDKKGIPINKLSLVAGKHKNAFMFDEGDLYTNPPTWKEQEFTKLQDSEKFYEGVTVIRDIIDIKPDANYEGRQLINFSEDFIYGRDSQDSRFMRYKYALGNEGSLFIDRKWISTCTGLLKEICTQEDSVYSNNTNEVSFILKSETGGCGLSLNTQGDTCADTHLIPSQFLFPNAFFSIDVDYSEFRKSLDLCQKYEALAIRNARPYYTYCTIEVETGKLLFNISVIGLTENNDFIKCTVLKGSEDYKFKFIASSLLTGIRCMKNVKKLTLTFEEDSNLFLVTSKDNRNIQFLQVT